MRSVPDSWTPPAARRFSPVSSRIGEPFTRDRLHDDRRRGSIPEIERIAVKTAMDYERSQGRKPVSVEEENCGWDITSLPGGQVARYIEVKGRSRIGGVALTPNEWIKAQRFGKDYWLYVVENCKTKPDLHLIQDPASKLSPQEEVSVVRYVVGQSDWRRAAVTSSPSEPEG
jgi:hypothetical protein